MNDYTVTLKLTVTADSPGEAIRNFRADVADPELWLSYDVTTEGETESIQA